MTYKLDLGGVKVNHNAKHLGQRSFLSKVVVQTQTHTADQLHYPDHKMVGY